jgi:hypothetical protein
MLSTDPEIEALAKVCGALSVLKSGEAKRRVLDFAYAKYEPKAPKKPREMQVTQDPDEDDGGDNLLARFDHKKPADNVNLLVAKHYAQYGIEPFTVSELTEEADAAGLVVPARIDMTLKQGGGKGKRFYQNLKKGQFRVTVHGESFLKETYGVKKGKKRKE